MSGNGGGKRGPPKKTYKEKTPVLNNFLHASVQFIQYKSIYLQQKTYNSFLTFSTNLYNLQGIVQLFNVINKGLTILDFQSSPMYHEDINHQHLSFHFRQYHLFNYNI